MVLGPIVPTLRYPWALGFFGHMSITLAVIALYLFWSITPTLASSITSLIVLVTILGLVILVIAILSIFFILTLFSKQLFHAVSTLLSLSCYDTFHLNYRVNRGTWRSWPIQGLFRLWGLTSTASLTSTLILCAEHTIGSGNLIWLTTSLSEFPSPDLHEKPRLCYYGLAWLMGSLVPYNLI